MIVVKVKMDITLLSVKLQRPVTTHFKAFLMLYTAVVTSEHKIKAKICKDHVKVDQKVYKGCINNIILLTQLILSCMLVLNIFALCCVKHKLCPVEVINISHKSLPVTSH